MNYFLGNPKGITMDQVIELGNLEHFSKLTCSIIPTIDYWKNLENKITALLHPDNYDVCFEYPVKSINKATSSYTDIMLISDNANIAIESKWTEKIGVYCEKHDAIRKDEVQKHWIDIISKYIDKKLSLEDFKNIEYQLLHRVASACSLGKKNCFVVYQIFYDKTSNDSFKKEILKLKTLLDSPKINFYLDNVKIEYNPIYEKLKTDLKGKNTKAEKIELIKNTIKQNNLFHFKDEELILL